MVRGDLAPDPFVVGIGPRLRLGGVIAGLLGEHVTEDLGEPSTTLLALLWGERVLPRRLSDAPTPSVLRR